VAEERDEVAWMEGVQRLHSQGMLSNLGMGTTQVGRKVERKTAAAGVPAAADAELVPL
jgi:hypothetical protein